MKALVTGARGFLGRHCLPLLVDRFNEVHAVTSVVPGAGVSLEQAEAASVRWHQADLLDSDQIDGLIAAVRPTHLLHLAWCTEHGKYWSDPVNHRWVQSGLHLLRAFRSSGGLRAVVSGSCAEYKWNNNICAETDRAEPATLYGRCKNELRLSSEQFSCSSGLSMAWGRLFLVFGPYEDRRRLIPSIINAVLDDSSARCPAGERIRDFLYVEDAAAALVKLLCSDVSGAVNICSGDPLTFKEFVGEISVQLGGKDHLICYGSLPPRPEDPEFLLGDRKRLEQEVGFQPRYDLTNSIEKTISWWSGRQEKK